MKRILIFFCAFSSLCLLCGCLTGWEWGSHTDAAGQPMWGDQRDEIEKAMDKLSHQK